MVTLDQGGAALPYLDLYPAARADRHWVEHSWIQRRIPGTDGAGWRIVPDVHPHVIHHRMLDGRTRTTVVGARSRFEDIPDRTLAFTVGVRLMPGTLPLLMGDDAWLLRDRAVRLGEVTGRSGAHRAEQLGREADPGRVRSALLDAIRHAVSGRTVDWRVRGLVSGLRSGSGDRLGPPVREASRALGVSERCLRDVCRSAIGLRPKEVHRITRLHGAVAQGLAGRRDADVARASGYADQGHLIRESHALLGETPAGFRERARAVSSKTHRRGRA